MTRMFSVAAAALLAASCATARARATAPPPPQDPEAAVARLLRDRIAAAGNTTPESGTLPAGLSRFYEARAWRPAWTRSLAAELLAAVEAAPADGLRAEDYPLDSIRLLLARAALDTADRAALDVLLSSTFLLYGLHLSAGRLTPWSVDPMWSAAPPPPGLDLAAALTVAIDSVGLAPALRGLAPPHPGYARLRAQLARVPGGAERVRQIEANLERWRWLPRDLGARYIMVDIPAFSLEVSDSGRTVHTARVIVGRLDWPTPITTAPATQLVFHPSWYIPRAIALAEVIPAQIRDSAYFGRAGIRVFPARGGREIEPATVDWREVTERNYAYRLVQDPGPANPLGAVRLHVANAFGVTLHDTPQRGLFSLPARALSHGCIRVERALELAELLLRNVPGWTPDTTAAVLRAGRERWVVLPEAVPVVLAYWTAWVDGDGVLRFRDDLYGWDARLAAALASPRAGLVSGARPSASAPCEDAALASRRDGGAPR